MSAICVARPVNGPPPLSFRVHEPSRRFISELDGLNVLHCSNSAAADDLACANAAGIAASIERHAVDAAPRRGQRGEVACFLGRKHERLVAQDMPVPVQCKRDMARMQRMGRRHNGQGVVRFTREIIEM